MICTERNDNWSFNWERIWNLSVNWPHRTILIIVWNISLKLFGFPIFCLLSVPDEGFSKNVWNTLKKIRYLRFYWKFVFQVLPSIGYRPNIITLSLSVFLSVRPSSSNPVLYNDLSFLLQNHLKFWKNIVRIDEII